MSSQGRRQAARPTRKLDMQGVGWGVVLTLLDWRWSPQQIAGTLKRVFPNEPERHVSHETIYNAIYAQPRGELRRQLVACLRRGRSTRMPRTRGDDRRGQIPEMVSIHVRPPEVNDRVMPGHWEGDFIKAAGNKSSVGVLVEPLEVFARTLASAHQPPCVNPLTQPCCASDLKPPLYIAPGRCKCRVYAMPYPLAPDQKPADLAMTHQLHDWREIEKLDRDHALVYIEPGYADFTSDIVGRQGGLHFEVTRHAA